LSGSIENRSPVLKAVLTAVHGPGYWSWKKTRTIAMPIVDQFKVKMIAPLIVSRLCCFSTSRAQ
jgi:hypothetical protein